MRYQRNGNKLTAYLRSSDSHKLKQQMTIPPFPKSFYTTSPPSKLNTTDAFSYHPQRDDYPLSAPPTKTQRRLVSPRRRTHQPHSNPTTPTKAASKQVYYSSEALRPCHICHRGPKLKTDLDSYAECARCSQRTCYICIRQCEGRPKASAKDLPEGSAKNDDQHSKTTTTSPNSGDGCGERKICSACCVERGVDGDVWCFDCLEDETVVEGGDTVMSD
jgi:hypothetical protein